MKILRLSNYFLVGVTVGRKCVSRVVSLRDIEMLHRSFQLLAN